MEEVEEDDVIVKEVPVYLSKQLTEHLYIYQYPLRPPHFKYDTTAIQSCAIKPQHQEVKLEHQLNINSVNFDVSKAEEIAINTDGLLAIANDRLFENELMDKQCFVSSKAVEDCNKYGVAVVHNNEIHITPLKGMIQLRPHFPYLDRSDKRAKEKESENKLDTDDFNDEHPEQQQQQVTVKFARNENDRLKKMRERSFHYLSKKSAEEPWCHTKWHHPHSDAAELERMKLLAESQDNVGDALDVPSNQYLRMLVPPDREQSEQAIPTLHHISSNCLKTLSLLDQCRLLLLNAKIITFQQLMLMLDGVDVETVLRTLPQVATLIKGCWIVRSDVLYPKDTYSAISGVPAHFMCRARDYILHLFNENEYVDRRKVSSVIKLPVEETKEIFVGIGRLRHKRGWELLLPQDYAFIDKYQDVVQRQRLLWETKQKQFSTFISDAANTNKKRRKSRSLSSTSNELELNHGMKRLNTDETETRTNVKKIKIET